MEFKGIGTVIDLQCNHWKLALSPEHGGTILSANVRFGDSNWKPVFSPLESLNAGWNGGCFVMAPFANRIYGGNFSFDGRDISFPMNRPASNMACHGIVREKPWQVLEQDATQALIQCRIDEENYPWRFSMTQKVSVSDAGLSIELRIINEGAKMPFGMGLHPWFNRTDDTRLTLSVPGFHHRDQTGLPLPTLDHHPAAYLDASQPLNDIAPFDSCSAGWPTGTVRIIQPSQCMELHLSASGSLARFVHLYVPSDREVFCVEPVSHPPDVVNRPALGKDAAMTILAPGETMAGGLRLQAFPADRSLRREIP